MVRDGIGTNLKFAEMAGSDSSILHPSNAGVVE